MFDDGPVSAGEQADAVSAVATLDHRQEFSVRRKLSEKSQSYRYFLEKLIKKFGNHFLLPSYDYNWINKYEYWLETSNETKTMLEVKAPKVYF